MSILGRFSADKKCYAPYYGFAVGRCFSVVSRSATGTTQHCFPCKLSASSLLRPVDAFFAPRPCFSSLQHFAPPIDNDFSALVMLFLQLFPVLKFPALMFFSTGAFPGKTPPHQCKWSKQSNQNTFEFCDWGCQISFGKFWKDP